MVANSNKHKILVVDDEPINIEALYSLFEDEYEVFGATSGEEAIKLAKQIIPDIILLDIMMPVMDGIETCLRLKTIPELYDIPVVFITGIVNELTEKKGFEAGCVDFITKPIRATVTKLRIKNHIKLKVQTDTLKKMSYIDGLTMIYNRRYFEEMLLKEWRRCSRNHKWLGILIFDIDFFKQYNDSYGHVAGDDCLKKVAKCLQVTLKRGGDFISRFGGEEFICILPETDIDGVKAMAEAALKAVRDLEIPHAKSEVAPFITISCGATATIPEEGQPSEVFIQNADILLYKAKRQGRNTFETLEMPIS